VEANDPGRAAVGDQDRGLAPFEKNPAAKGKPRGCHSHESSSGNTLTENFSSNRSIPTPLLVAIAGLLVC